MLTHRRQLFLVVRNVASSAVIATAQPPPTPRFSSNQILVAFQPGTPAATIPSIHAQRNATIQRTIPAINVQVLSVPEGTVLNMVEAYQKILMFSMQSRISIAVSLSREEEIPSQGSQREKPITHDVTR